MKTLVLLLHFVFVAGASTGCYSKHWWADLDKTIDTWATCSLRQKEKYITGFWRSGFVGAYDDRIGRLELARCCSPAALYLATAIADCVDANWFYSFDQLVALLISFLDRMSDWAMFLRFSF